MKTKTYNYIMQQQKEYNEQIEKLNDDIDFYLQRIESTKRRLAYVKKQETIFIYQRQEKEIKIVKYEKLINELSNRIEYIDDIIEELESKNELLTNIIALEMELE